MPLASLRNLFSALFCSLLPLGQGICSHGVLCWWHSVSLTHDLSSQAILSACISDIKSQIKVSWNLHLRWKALKYLGPFGLMLALPTTEIFQRSLPLWSHFVTKDNRAFALKVPIFGTPRLWISDSLIPLQLWNHNSKQFFDSIIFPFFKPVFSSESMYFAFFILIFVWFYFLFVKASGGLWN